MSNTCGFCFGLRRSSGKFSDLATCRMPPPCNDGFRQFKMPGTNSMCCRKIPTRRPRVPRVPVTRSRVPGACPSGKVRCRANGRCVLRRNLSKCGRSTTARSEASVNLKNAKQQLKNKYNQMINGKLKSPGFITNLKTVNGKNSAEKIANINRVLNACRRSGVPLVKKDGKNFKAFSTLVAQCNVKFSRESPSGSILSDRRGGGGGNNLIQQWRARRANERSSLDADFNRALNTPLPDDDDSDDEFFDANEFGKKRTRRVVRRVVRKRY